MSTRTICIVSGTPIYEDTLTGRCWMTSDADIDADGVGDDGQPNNIYNDPYYQPDTTLHNNGVPLNALSERYIVLPKGAIAGVSKIVMGCQCKVHYLRTGEIKNGVVGDRGPSTKTGELSVAYAQDLMMPHNPNTGGESDFGFVVYEWWPGLPAFVDGVHYHLQPSVN